MQDQSEPPGPPANPASPRRLVLGIFFLSLGTGLFAGATDPNAINILALPFAALVFLWVKADSRARGVRPFRGAAVLSALLAPVGIPIYLFTTRDRKAALLGFGKAVLFFAVLTIATEVAVFLGGKLSTGPFGGGL